MIVDDVRWIERLVPVGVKLVSKTLPHKSKLGGVRLALDSVDEVEAAVVTMQHAVRQVAPQQNVDQVLVEEMVEDVCLETNP